MIESAAKNKLENHQLYSQGLLGNHLKSWNKFEDFYEDTYDDNIGEYALRTNGAPGLVLPHYCEAGNDSNTCLKIHDLWVKNYGIPSRQICFFEAAPRAVIFQGEVGPHLPLPMDDPSIKVQDTFPFGLALRCSRKNLMMRQALIEAPEHYFGLQATLLLQKYMDSASYENLQRLLAISGNNVVEFSCFDRSLGAFNWNTIFWEFRAY